MEDVGERFAEADCVTLGEEYDAVEGVGNDEYRTLTVREIEILDKLAKDFAVNVRTEDHVGRERRETPLVKTCGFVAVGEKEDHFVATCLKFRGYG